MNTTIEGILPFILALTSFTNIAILGETMETQNRFDRRKPYAIVESNGVVEFFANHESLGDVKLAVHGLEWTYRDQRAATVEEVAGLDGNVLRAFSGSIEIPSSDGRRMEFTEMLTGSEKHDFVLRYKIHFPEAVKLNSYQVSFTIKPERLGGQKVHLIGDETEVITIPVQYESMHLAAHRVREVRVAPEHAEGFALQLDGDSSLSIQDNRRFGSSDIELRFNFHARGVGQEVPAGETVERAFKVCYNQQLFLAYNEDKQVDRNDTSNWTPFVLSWDDAPLDLSFLNEKPAGKHGFLKVEGDQFIFEDGTPARFWGTCFSAGANFPTHSQSEKIARRLAKFGVNIVRTHHADANWASPNLFESDINNPKKDNTLSLDPESLDRFDYLIYCLKNEGIYVYLDQLVHRKFKSGDGIDAVDQLPNAAKPYSNFDPRLIELQKKFSHDLWAHVNPYTGLAYRSDPAIALMEFANENDLFTQKVTLEPYRSRLEDRYRAWVKEHDVEVGPDPVDFTQFSEPVLKFLHEVQRAYYVEMREYLRSIGVRVPMTGSNWSRNLALLSSLMVVDYTDSHSYWDHPQGGKFNNRPMVGTDANVFAWLSFNRVLGKPFFVSEWDQPWPNEWRAEHTLAMAAVASFQGWNGLTVYTYRHSTSVPVGHLSGSFETFNDPARFGLFYHAALIFRRGDVDPARQTMAIQIPEETILQSPNLTPRRTPALLASAERHRLEMDMGKEAGMRDNLILQSFDQRAIEEDATEVSSDTGQLHRSWEKRTGTIDTPYTKAAYGFAGEVESIQMRGLALHVRTPFATIAISSLTDEPIEESTRILLTTVGRAENTDFVYNIVHTRMLQRGTGPVLVEPIEATVELKTTISGLKVWTVGADGKRVKQMPAKMDGDRLVFDIGREGETIYYLIEGD